LEEIAPSKQPRKWQLKRRNKSQLGKKKEKKILHQGGLQEIFIPASGPPQSAHCRGSFFFF
jgi:hypothetical protein